MQSNVLVYFFILLVIIKEFNCLLNLTILEVADALEKKRYRVYLIYEELGSYKAYKVDELIIYRNFQNNY